MCDRIRKLELRMKAAEDAVSENTGRTILIEEKVKNYRSYASVAKHNLNDSMSEIPKILARTFNTDPGLHVTSESNQVIAQATKPTSFGSHQRSVSNVDQQSNVAGMGFQRQSLRTIPNVLHRYGSMTSIVSDIPSGYNDGYRYQCQQCTRHHPN